LKDAEARGDVNWQQVKEVHDSFKYSSQGLGAGAEIILAIAMSLAMGPAGLGMGTVSAAGAGSLATTAVNSTISNNGNLGKALKDTVSASSIKSAGVAMLTAGVGEELQFDPTSLSANTLVGATETAVADAAITTAIEGGSFSKNLLGAAVGEGVTVAGATLANDISGSSFAGGKLTKVGLHALLGGVLSVAQGGDFATGALAAGGDEALVDMIADKFAPDIVAGKGTSQEREAQRAMLLGASKLIGVAAAGATGGDVGVGAEVANNATEYNFLGPASEARRAAARKAMEHGTATAAQKAEFVSDSKSDQRSDYLGEKLQLGIPLTDAETTELNGYFVNYVDEMTAKFGAAAAAKALTDLKQEGSYKTYDYPFAGTDEEKRAWTAANTASVTDFFKTEFRTPSADEKLYNSVGHSDQIAKAQEDDARIGQLALLPEEEAIAGLVAAGAEIFGKGVSDAGAVEGALVGGAEVPALVTSNADISSAALQKDVPSNLQIESLATVSDPAIDPAAIRSSLEPYVKSADTDNISIAVGSVEVDGETQYILSVSGKGWKGNSPKEVNVSGVDYKVVTTDSGSLASASNGFDGVTNFNHAEQKLMSYLQDTYAGKSANISIGVENTSASKPGMCLGCAITSRKFAGDNPLFDVRFFEGSSGVNP
jgi:filamentous hemagglutinin